VSSFDAFWGNKLPVPINPARSRRIVERPSWCNGRSIAEARGDVRHQAELVSTLTMFHTRGGNCKTALHYAKLGQALARTVADATAIAVAHSVLGRSLHYMGDHSAARAALEASLQYWSNLPGTSAVYLGFDHHILVSIGLARTLWLQGHPAQAVERMRQTIRDAERRDNPVFSLGFALFWAPEIFLWVAISGAPKSTQTA
jgi:hypothetical protein